MQYYRSQTALVALVYFILIATYFFSVHLYCYFCAPASIWGFLKSPLLIETIECRALKWLFNYSHEYIRTLWVLVSAYGIKLIMDLFSLLKNSIGGTPNTVTPLATPPTTHLSENK